LKTNTALHAWRIAGCSHATIRQDASHPGW
jgi:hypothetical protein